MSDPDVLDEHARKVADRLGLGAPAPIVQNADTVNVDQPRDGIPHVRIVATVTFVIVAGMIWVTWHTLRYSDDATVKGALIGTWSTVFVAAVSFWVGASSGGKLRK